MNQPLLVFVTVVEKESFSRAAEELHMTQPAVSQYIQQLEFSIGARLLERSNKFVRLNEAGKIVYHHAKEMLGLYTRMECLVDDLMNKASGPLSIGASFTYGEYILPHVMTKICKDYPQIVPNITIGNTNYIAALVKSYDLDCGIIEGELLDDKLTIEPFATDTMNVMISANHRFANKVNVSKAELEAETWVVREQGSGTRAATEKVFAKLCIQPSKVIECGSTKIIKETVREGLGLTLLSDWTVKRELSLGELYRLELEGLPLTRAFSLVTQKTTFHTKAMEVFLEYLQK